MKSGFGGLLLVLCAALSLAACNYGAVPDGFERISENGFDAADNEADWNDYPWSMAHFVPDGAAEGYLYVGTGNGIEELVFERAGILDDEETAARLATTPVWIQQALLEWPPSQIKEAAVGLLPLRENSC